MEGRSAMKGISGARCGGIGFVAGEGGGGILSVSALGESMTSSMVALSEGGRGGAVLTPTVLSIDDWHCPIVRTTLGGGWVGVIGRLTL